MSYPAISDAMKLYKNLFCTYKRKSISLIDTHDKNNQNSISLIDTHKITQQERKNKV